LNAGRAVTDSVRYSEIVLSSVAFCRKIFLLASEVSNAGMKTSHMDNRISHCSEVNNSPSGAGGKGAASETSAVVISSTAIEFSADSFLRCVCLQEKHALFHDPGEVELDMILAGLLAGTAECQTDHTQENTGKQLNLTSNCNLNADTFDIIAWCSARRPRIKIC
jgi:hypothetical protein